MSAVPPTVSVASEPAAPATPAKQPSKKQDGLTFADIIDIINPLQHIPVIGTLYRRFTGDTESPTAEIFGGALYGGILGAVSSVADVLFTQATGKDFGNTVLGWLGFDKKTPATQFADTKVKPSPSIQKASVPPTPKDSIPGMSKLMDSLQRQGVSPDVAARAAAAYRRALGLTDTVGAMPVPAL